MTDERTKEDYLVESFLERIDPALVDQYGDPNRHPEYQLSPAQVSELLEKGREAFISHLAPKDGFPITTVHVYCFLDGELWTTSVKGRVKAAALRKDPRCSLCISAAGLGLPFGGGLTLKCNAAIVEDRDTVERVCRAHAERYYKKGRARDLFFGTLFTPNRVAVKLEVLKTISWSNIGVKPE